MAADESDLTCSLGWTSSLGEEALEYGSFGLSQFEASSLGWSGSLFSSAEEQAARSASIGVARGSFEKPVAAAPAARQPVVSVLVTARNYGCFLKECLQSIVDQTHPVDEILYSDDGSEDESLDVAHQFRQVKILSRKHEGIAPSRNAAVAASRGELLVHVDGDDMLTPNFIERHLKALQTNPEATFAYGPAEGFGIRNCKWDAPPWNRQLLWVRNYVNTSAMYRRWAFEAAGGWRTGVGTCFDWDLALRASRFGPAVASTALLRYRQHAQSWSRTYWKDRQVAKDVLKCHSRIRQMAATVTIGCVYSGRLPGLLPKWLEALAATIRESDLPRPNLLFVDGTPEQNSGDRLLNAACRYPEFRQVRYSRVRSELRPPFQRQERDERARFMATACNQILDASPSDVVWFVEDDILVPGNAYFRLLSLLMDGKVPHAGVAGLYRSRHDPSAFVAHQKGEKIVTLRSAPRQVTPVDMTGTGCLMILRPFARHRFSGHVNGIPAHDWEWCLEAKQQGRPVLIDPEVLCRHFVDEQRFV